MDKYHTIEKILTYYDGISIVNGWNTALDEDEIERAYLMRLDIIELVYLGEDQKV
jgi:hypothetical protein